MPKKATLREIHGLFCLGAGNGYDAATDYSGYGDRWAPPPAVVDAVLESLSRVNEAAAKLGLPPVTVWLVPEDSKSGSDVARFLAGTAAEPAFVLFTDAHAEALNEVFASLLHELAHAYIESIACETTEDDEDAAEAFARDYEQGVSDDDAICALEAYAGSLID